MPARAHLDRAPCSSGDFLTPSPPAEKATTRQEKRPGSPAPAMGPGTGTTDQLPPMPRADCGGRSFRQTCVSKSALPALPPRNSRNRTGAARESASPTLREMPTRNLAIGQGDKVHPTPEARVE